MPFFAKNFLGVSLLDSAENIAKYTYGNLTIVGQSMLAGVSLCSGICSISDTMTCLSIPAKCCYAASSVCSFASFGCYGAAAISQVVAAPTAPLLLSCGIGTRCAGQYLQKAGSAMNPLPALSDVV